MKYLFLISLPLYLLDRVTKYFVLACVSPEEPRVVIPNFFHIVDITNTGAAFGSFTNNNPFFVVISCIALIVALILLLRKPVSETGKADSTSQKTSAWRDVSLALLIAGVLGNLTDRLLYGHVIDFLLFDFGSHVPSFLHPWPAFNVADSCICVAVVCFVVHSFRHERQQAASAGEPNSR